MADTVYLLFQDDDAYGSWLQGVFSTQERAEQRRQEYIQEMLVPYRIKRGNRKGQVAKWAQKAWGDCGHVEEATVDYWKPSDV